MKRTRKEAKPTLLTTGDVRDLLRAEVARTGTQTEWARQRRVDRSIVCSFLTGGKTLQPRIVKALGLRKIIAYTPS
jgi:hypothetical protein